MTEQPFASPISFLDTLDPFQFESLAGRCFTSTMSSLPPPPVIGFQPICVIIFKKPILLVQEGSRNENHHPDIGHLASCGCLGRRTRFRPKLELKYRIEDGRIYDKNWHLKGYLQDGKIYDHNWQLKGGLKKANLMTKSMIPPTNWRV